MTDDNGVAMHSETSETRRLTVNRAVEGRPERVYRAFVDPEERAEGMYPPGSGAEVHSLEPEEGGTYRITMRDEAEEVAEHGHTNGRTFRKLVPGERTVETDDPGMVGEMPVTITFEKVSNGTAVTVEVEQPVTRPDDGIAGWEAAQGNLTTPLEVA